MDATLSYTSSPNNQSYMYNSLPDRLRYLANQDGHREAFVYYNREWKRSAISRKELYDQSISLAKVLVTVGLGHKATVGFCMANSVEMLITNMAVTCAGGVPFYIGTNLKDGSDVINVLNDMLCEMFIIDTDFGDDNWKILENVWPVGTPHSTSVPSLKTVICNGNLPEGVEQRTTLASLLQRQPDVETKLPRVQPEDVLACFCTSGTTGEPKQIIYTHYNILNWTKLTDVEFGITSESRLFCDRTFSWGFGFPRTYLTEGTTRIFVDPVLTTSKMYTERVADVIEAEKCDVVHVRNYLAVDLLEHSDLSSKFAAVKKMIFVGERVPQAYTELINNYCKTLCIIYGTTESGNITVYKCDKTEDYEDGIIGKPIGGMEIKLIDESGTVVPQGRQGELCTRSTWRFVDYRGNDELFRQAVDQSNWFHTGDVAHIRDDGNIVLDGRQKELISMQTSKFFPWSIEQTLKKMAGVLHAFAVGIPIKRSFEVVCACVLPRDGCMITSDDVKSYCDDVFLDKSPSMVITTKPTYHVVLETVPLTRSGKIDRLKIAAIAKVRLGV